MNVYWNEENKKKGQELLKIAQEMGTTATQLAIAWCLKRREVTSVILGTRTVEQLQENLKAVELEIPEEVMIKLDELYPTVNKIPTA